MRTIIRKIGGALWSFETNSASYTCAIGALLRREFEKLAVFMNQDRRSFVAGSLAAMALPTATFAQQKPAQEKQSALPAKFEAASARALLRGGDAPATEILSWSREPGVPVLRIRKGDRLKLQLKNALAQPTSFHIRGMRGPNAFDGVPPLTGPAVAPQGAADIDFVPPDAGTFYFHPHAESFAAEQAGRGLGGVLIVEEEKAPETDHDLVLAFATWRLDGKGALVEPIVDPAETASAGRLGDLLTINNAPAPYRHEAGPGARIRLRFVNMAMAQLAAITFEGAQPFIAAIDSQPCNPFEPVNRTFPIAPGARFDVVFDMPAKENDEVKIVMRRWPVAGRKETPPEDFAIFTAKGKRAAARAERFVLAANPLLPPVIPLQNSKRLDLTIAPARSAKRDPRRLWTINGVSMSTTDPKPLLTVKRGTPVSLGFINKSDVPHVMRVSGHVMRQLHLLDDGWEPYWRDSVIVPEGRTVRIAFLADNPGKWFAGSGILAHAESGLASWIEVL